MIPAPIAHRTWPVVFVRAAAAPPSISCPHGNGARERCSLCLGVPARRVEITPWKPTWIGGRRADGAARERERDCERCGEPFVVDTQSTRPEALAFCRTCREHATPRISRRQHLGDNLSTNGRKYRPRRQRHVPHELLAPPDDLIDARTNACRDDRCPIEELHAAHADRVAGSAA